MDNLGVTTNLIYSLADDSAVTPYKTCRVQVAKLTNKHHDPPGGSFAKPVERQLDHRGGHAIDSGWMRTGCHKLIERQLDPLGPDRR